MGQDLNSLTQTMEKKCNMSDYFPYKEIQGLEDALENVLFSVLTLSFRVDLTHL